MPYLIGTDEAGYGPNLGPLVVTGTLWEIPSVDVDLYKLFAEVVDSKRSPDRIAVCDSKEIYKSSGTIEALERSVLSLLDSPAANWRELVAGLGCGREKTETESWLVGAEFQLPMLTDLEEIENLKERFLACCESVGVKLLEVQTSTLFPKKFNEAIESQGNKANVLSSTTLEIVSKLLNSVTGPLPTDGKPQPVRIVCDKHGGRSKYAAVIQNCLTEQPVLVHEESRSTSRYSWTTDTADVAIEFNAGGESALPVALASMVSKYVREVYMKLWNRFWLTHLPGIKPTKGYPQDAKRFFSEIQSRCQELQIQRETVWRTR